MHTLTEVSRTAKLPPAYLRELLRALGRPDPARGERAFTDEDVELVRMVRRLADAGMPRDELLLAARAVGQHMSQIAEALRRLVGDALLEPGVSEVALGRRYAEAVDDLGPLILPFLELSLRAHLRDGIRREIITEAEREEGRLADTRDVAVAFADLVGYTKLGGGGRADRAGLDRRAVRHARRRGRAGAGAAREDRRRRGDARLPGRRKRSSRPLADLRDRVEACEPELPEVRIGVAYGAATPQFGDWFGATVNLASRITQAAKPGPAARRRAASPNGSNGGRWRRRRRRSLKGVDGRVRLLSYEGAAD